MDSSIGFDHAIGAGCALAVAVTLQTAYSWRQLRTKAGYRQPQSQAEMESSFRLRILMASAVALFILGLGFLVSGIVLLHVGQFTSAYAMLICCKGTSVLSIWSFEVVDLLYPARHRWMTRYNAPISDWGCIIFCSGLALQLIFTGLGLWQLISFRLEFVWAIPTITHMNISAVMGYAVVFSEARRPPLLWLWFLAGVCTSATALGLCVFAACHRMAGHAAVQCFLCGPLLFIKAYRDFRKSNGRKELDPENNPGGAPSAPRDANWASAYQSQSSLTTLPAPRRHRSGSDLGIQMVPPTPTPTPATSSRASRSSSIRDLQPFLPAQLPRLPRSDSTVGLLSRTPTASPHTSLSSSITGTGPCGRLEIGRMQFPIFPFSVSRVDRYMEPDYATIHAFHKKINNGKVIPDSVGRPESILDVGAGTGEWALDARDDLPNAQVLCTDLCYNPALQMRGMVCYPEDVNDSKNQWRNRLDYIHFRNLDGGIKDWGVTFKMAFASLRVGGFIGVEDLIFYQPPRNLAPGSIWHDWQDALDRIRIHTGLSFGLHDTGRAQDKLVRCGFSIVSVQGRPFNLKLGDFTFEGRDLVLSIIEFMKGVFARGLELQTPGIVEQSLLHRLEEELISHGIVITVASIVAQKTDSILPLLLDKGAAPISGPSGTGSSRPNARLRTPPPKHFNVSEELMQPRYRI